ncbi:DHA2 family efflux MFS transporter permease subunit [Yinghuangia seranimata]|uniref:DHA2 family efflux MFS transporter permease subunit n=1 Tax=Yinghuangia seranimata TaxID=408067 RepID=UPI00248AC945|nr:DHA2 family efflux MFS transporter permease subunit [Yinghuangia seranimata]MDI2125907.1 DHA2 family efflux MFS transporter permease subunit [Yinghuangia seranimata]
MSQAAPRTPEPPRSRALVAAVVCAGVVLVNIDLFIVNVAVPAMARTWSGADLADLSWVLNGYAVVFAALLVPAGRLADRSGHRAAFLRGTALFTAASALCAAAPNVGFLVAARLLQAAGGALLVPSSLGLLLTSFPPEKRAGIVRVWAAVGGLAAAVGPVLGGLLVEPGWRWVFLINLPIGVATVLIGARVLPAGTPAAERAPLPDLLGALLFVVAIGALSLGLVKAEDWGWASPRADAAWAVAALGAAWFAVRTARHPRPLVAPGMLRVRAFSVAGAASVLFGVAFASMLLGITLWCQDVWGWSALRTGLAITPGPLLVPPTSILSGRWAARLGAATLASSGAVVFAAGTLWWAYSLDTGSPYASSMLPGMMATGVGVGLMLPTLVAAATTALPPQFAATGSGVATMLRQLGSVLGVSLVVVLLGTPTTTAGVLNGFDRVWYLQSGAALAAAAVALLLARPRGTDRIGSKAAASAPGRATSGTAAAGADLTTSGTER